MKFKFHLDLKIDLDHRGVNVAVDDISFRYGFPNWFRGNDRDIEILGIKPHVKLPFNLVTKHFTKATFWLVELTVQNRHRPWTRRKIYRLHLIKWNGNYDDPPLYADDIPSNQLKSVDQNWCWDVAYAYEAMCVRNDRKFGESVFDLIQWYHPNSTKGKTT